MVRKIIKKKRNPSMEEEIREKRLKGYFNLIYELNDAIIDGNPINFVNTLVLYKQGENCDDCGDLYKICICEKCDDCGFRRNLCYLNITYKGNDAENYTKSERELIKKEAYEFLFYILNDDLYNDGRKYNIIHDKFKELKEEFLTNVLSKSKIDLSWANLHKVDLTGVNLSRANLSEASLYLSNLSKANLSKANLSKANLSKANLSDADLSGANLSDADLFRTNFTNAIIKNTNFNNAENINDAINLKIPNPRKKSIRRRK